MNHPYYKDYHPVLTQLDHEHDPCALDLRICDKIVLTNVRYADCMTQRHTRPPQFNDLVLFRKDITFLTAGYENTITL